MGEGEGEKEGEEQRGGGGGGRGRRGRTRGGVRKESFRREELMISSRRQDGQGPALGPQTALPVSQARSTVPHACLSTGGGETDIALRRVDLHTLQSRQLPSLYKRLPCLKRVPFIKYAF